MYDDMINIMRVHSLIRNKKHTPTSSDTGPVYKPTAKTCTRYTGAEAMLAEERRSRWGKYMHPERLCLRSTFGMAAAVCPTEPRAREKRRSGPCSLQRLPTHMTTAFCREEGTKALGERYRVSQAIYVRAWVCLERAQHLITGVL